MSPGLDWDRARDRDRTRPEPPTIPISRRNLPATAKQLRYLSFLGVVSPPRMTRSQASALIDELSPRKRP